MNRHAIRDSGSKREEVHSHLSIGRHSTRHLTATNPYRLSLLFTPESEWRKPPYYMLHALAEGATGTFLLLSRNVLSITC